MKKISSILDYVYPGLDPEVWGSDGKLLPEHKKTINDIISKELARDGMKEPVQWIKQVKIIGSLTSYQYAIDSDLDVHVVIDLPKFIEINNPEWTPEEANEVLLNIHRRIRKDPPLVPGTQHPFEFFFENPVIKLNKNLRAGIYDVGKDTWLQEAQTIDKDFDIKEIKSLVIDLANEMAQALDSSFGGLKRNIKEIEELQGVTKAWDGEQKEKYKVTLQERLTMMEKEISELGFFREDITKKRRDFDPLGDTEVQYKYLQRYGYITLIKKLEEFWKDDQQITEDEIPEIKKILTPTSTLNKKAEKEPGAPSTNKLMIDFDSTIADNSDVDWPGVGEPMPNVKEALDKLKAEGWEITIYSCRANDDGGIDQIKAFMDDHDLPYDDLFIGKPSADFYIDDKSVLFTNWRDVVNTVREPNDKEASFSPSITPHAPTNRWGPYDVVIPVDPDAASTEKTYYAPHVDKPREQRKGFWRSIIDLFRGKNEAQETDTLAPPPVSDSKKQLITSPGVTDMMQFYKEAPQDAQKEVKRLLENGETQEAWALIKKHLDRSTLKMSKTVDQPTPKRYHSKTPNTTWDSLVKDQGEPFNALPRNVQWTTNDKNLNWRYPYRFMKKPTGPGFTDENKVLWMITDDKETEGSPKAASVESRGSTYTDKEMEEIYVDQHEMHDDETGGGGFITRDWNHSTTDFPKPEDLEKYKVRLDIIDNPATRNFQLGIPSYEVTWLFGLPAQ